MINREREISSASLAPLFKFHLPDRNGNEGRFWANMEELILRRWNPNKGRANPTGPSLKALMENPKSSFFCL